MGGARSTSAELHGDERQTDRRGPFVLDLGGGGDVDQIESLWEVVALVSPYTTWRFIKASSPAASHCHVDPLHGSDCSGVRAE